MQGKQSSGIRLFLTNSFSSVITRVLQVTVLVWVNQHLLRRIEPEEYSLFPLVLSLMFFADILRNLVTGGLSRFIVEADSRGDNEQVTRIVSSMFPVVLSAAAAFLACGAIALWRLDDFLKIETAYLGQAKLMFGLMVSTLCLNVIASPFTDGLYIRQRFVALNLIELSCEALRIVVLLSLLLAVSTSVVWLVVASTIAAVANVSARAIVTRRLIPAIHFRKDLASFATARTLLRFGAWTSVQGITALIATTAPVLLLNRFGTAIDVAAFYLGRLPEIQIRGFASVAAAPALPAMTRTFALKGEGSLNDLYYRGGRYFLWATLFLVPPLIVFGRNIFELYAGSRYTAAATVTMGLLGAYPFLWASAMFFQVAHAIGKIGAYYICDIVVQAVTLGALVFATKGLDAGAGGAGLAMGIAGALVHLLLIWPMGLRLVKGKWRLYIRQTLLPGMSPFFAALFGCLLLSIVIEWSSWANIALGCLCSAVIYVAVLVLFCLDAFERSLICRVSSRVRLPFGCLATSRG